MDYLSLNHPHKTKILTWLIHKIKIALNLKRKTRQERNVKHRRMADGEKALLHYLVYMYTVHKLWHQTE